MMAACKPVFLVSFALLVVFILSDNAEAYPSSKTSARSNQKRNIRIKQMTANYGATCKLRCKILSKMSEVVWLKDGLPLNITKSRGYEVKRRAKLELFKISKMTIKHFGLYECILKNRRRGAWKISLSDGKELKCKRTRRGIGEKAAEKACGEAARKILSSCVDSRFPKCNSYAGLPKDIKTAIFINQGKAVVQIGWKSPENGYEYDLWGYQVHIIGLAGNAGHQKCIQLNYKDGHTYWTFHEIAFDAQYKLMLQSMPSKEMFQKKVYVKEKCKFKEFKLKPSCCFVSNFTSTVNVDSGTISLSWSILCADNTINIQRFKVAWTNIQNPGECHGVQIIQSAVSESSRSNCSIVLSEKCQQHNFSIRVFGIHDSNDTTTPAKVIVSYPKKLPAALIPGPKDNSTKVFVAVAGILFGLALVTLFFVYKYCCTKVIYKLPISLPSHPGEQLLDDGPKRVFLMSARCCEKCNWVLHCLGELLTSTGLAVVRTDIWFENQISSSVFRWYEEEIREANCVVVLASRKMTIWNQRRTVSESERNSEDLLDIIAQLNLISGEITKDPDSPKFIPAYFKYNGESKDIPDFLSSRLAHKLPDDLNRLVYHVLNIEAIQPYRTRPIVVLGGNDHPFESRKKDVLTAIAEAEEMHQSLLERKNNNSVA